MRVSPWTIVCLIGFPMYALLGWLHGGGGARSTAYYVIAGLLFAGAVTGLMRGKRRTKPPTP